MVFHLWWISWLYSNYPLGWGYSKVFRDTNEDRKFQWTFSKTSTRFCCLLQLFQSLACLRSSLPLFSEPAKSTRCNLEMVFLCRGGFNMFQPSGKRAAVTWTHQPRFRVDILTLGTPPVLGRTMAVDHTIGDVSDPFLSFCFKGTLWGTFKHPVGLHTTNDDCMSRQQNESCIKLVTTYNIQP